MLIPSPRGPLELVVAAAVALALASAAGCGTPPAGTRTYAGNDREIVAAAGEMFSIKLRSDHSTGFRWEVLRSFNTTVVRKARFKYTPHNDPTAACGYDTWTFEAVGKGRTALCMSYSRPMTPSTATRRFDVTVR